jgi:hypothetical protein
MGRRGLALLLGFALASCTQEVDPSQRRSKVLVAPITAQQVGDLMSSSVQNKDGNLFVTVEPNECNGVAREVNPPLIVDHAPVATDGGHWMTDDGREVYIEELAGVYRADFDARAAIAKAKRLRPRVRGRTLCGHRARDVFTRQRLRRAFVGTRRVETD